MFYGPLQRTLHLNINKIGFQSKAGSSANVCI